MNQAPCLISSCLAIGRDAGQGPVMATPIACGSAREPRTAVRINCHFVLWPKCRSGRERSGGCQPFAPFRREARHQDRSTRGLAGNRGKLKRLAWCMVAGAVGAEACKAVDVGGNEADIACTAF